MQKTVFILDGATEIDITGRSAVIYGAGKACVTLLHRVAFPSIACIVDGNPEKQNTEFVVGTMRIPICSPDILRSLDPASHFIVISSSKFADEIRAKIQSIIPSTTMLICSNQLSLSDVCSYDSLEELLSCNAQTKAALENSHWAGSEETVIRFFKDAFAQAHGDLSASSFFPVRNGFNNLIFGYTIGDERYIFRCIGEKRLRRWTHSEAKIELSKAIERARSEFGIGYELLVYRDESGNTIEHFGDTPSISDLDAPEFVPEVLQLLRALHAVPAHIPRTVYYFETWYGYNAQHLEPPYSEGEERLGELCNLSRRIITAYKKLPVENRVCHGDCHFNNIVRYKGKLQLIDWDRICMGDPLSDVCSFHYSMSMRSWWSNAASYGDAARSCYGTIDDVLRCYLERPCTEQEHARALLLLKGYEIISFFDLYRQRGFLDFEQLDTILHANPVVDGD